MEQRRNFGAIMKNITILFISLACSSVFGQNYPSPIYNNLTVEGNFTAPYSITLNNPSASTYGGKLNQIVNITDFGPTCNGVNNDDTAVSAAIVAIAATPTTLVISCPLKISANHTFAPGTQLYFQANGEILGTTGSEVVQVQQQIIAGRTQIFNNLSPQADIGMEVYPEWFGGTQTSSDSSVGFNKAYLFLVNVGGAINMAAGTYTIQNSITVKGKVSLLGAGQNITQINVSGTNINGIVASGVLGTPLMNNVFRGFNITSSTAGTTNTGISLAFTALAKLSDIQINNFITGVAMECATNSFFESMGVAYGASTNGFTGWSINGGGGCAGGNESSVWRDTYAVGSAISSGGPTGQIGYHAFGAYVSDLYFSNNTAGETNYGYFLDYSTATAGGYADVEIHNPIVDGFTAQAIFINAMPAQQMLTISDGWINPAPTLAETDGLYITTSAGNVQAIGMQIGGENNYNSAVGARIIGSTNTHISNSTFNDNVIGVQESSSARCVYSGNSFINQSAHPATAQIQVTGSTRTMVESNSFDGFAVHTITADNTSTGVGVVGNTLNSATLSAARIVNSSTSPIGASDGSTGLNSGI